MPDEGLLHLRVEVPVVFTLVALSEHVSPVVGLTVAVREIIPVNPPTGVNEIVEEPVTCGLTIMESGLAVTMKSGRGTTTWIVIVGLLLTLDPEVALIVA